MGERHRLRRTGHFANDSDSKTRLLFIEFLLHLIFLFCATLVVFALRNVHMFYFNKTLERHFLHRSIMDRSSSKFDEMSTTTQWWQFIKETLEAFDFKSNTTDSNFQKLLDENLLLGPPRLRQIRVLKESCRVHNIFDRYFDSCHAPYDASIEDTSPIYKETKYHTLAEVNSWQFTGHVTTYYGGGYIKDFTFDSKDNNKILENLQRMNWVDRGTRLILFEFAVYNAITELFDDVKFSAEVLPVGGVLTYARLRTLPLYSIWKQGTILEILAAIIYYSFIIWFTFQLIYNAKFYGFKSTIFRFWTYVDIVVVLSGYGSFYYNIYHPLKMRQILASLNITNESYVNIDSICRWHEIYIYVLALGIFCAWIKIFRYLRLNRTLQQFAVTLHRCAKDLMGFAFMFFIVFLAYASMGMLLFGTYLQSFFKFGEAILTTMRMVLGDFDYNKLEETDRMWGPIYFLSYILLVFFVLLNMFLAIIADTYTEVKTELKAAGESAGSKYLKKKLHAFCSRLCPRLLNIIELKMKQPEKPYLESEEPIETKDQSQNTEVQLPTRAVLNEYFQDVDLIDSEHAKLLGERISVIEDLLEELVANMDFLLKKVEGKKRKQYN